MTEGAPQQLDHDVVELVVPPRLDAVAAARRLAVEQCAGLPSAARDAVELVVGELVANAVRHGSPDVVLRLRVHTGGVDIAVLDHGPGRPQVVGRAESTRRNAGRGLQLVDGLAQFWGVHPMDGGGPGKIIWASMARRGR